MRLLGAAAAWPLAARAQSKPMPIVGILDPDVTFIFDAFVEGMRDLGYVEGRNIAYARKVLHGNFVVLSALAAELVDQKVDVVVTVSPPLIRAVERASNTMPIVVLASPDPVLAGFVKSFAHPGGNITGLSFVDEELAAKRLDLLRELVPNLRNVAVFWWGDPKGQGRTAAERAGQALGPSTSSPGTGKRGRVRTRVSGSRRGEDGRGLCAVLSVLQREPRAVR